MKAASSVGRAGPRQQLRGAAGGQHTAGVHGDEPVEPRGLVHVGGGHHDAHARAVRRRMASIRSQNCRRDSGSTPVVGSSRMRRSGSWISAQHRPSFCFIPPESLPAGRSAKGPEPVPSSSSSIRRSRSAGPGRTAGRRSRRSRRPTASDRDSCRDLAACRRCAGSSRAGVGIGHVAAEHLDPPGLDGTCAPGNQRKQAGLADAVRPDEPDHAARGDVEGDVVQRARLAVREADVAEARYRSRSGAGSCGKPEHSLHKPLTASGWPATRRSGPAARRPLRAGRS